MTLSKSGGIFLRYCISQELPVLTQFLRNKAHRVIPPLLQNHGRLPAACRHLGLGEGAVRSLQSAPNGIPHLSPTMPWVTGQWVLHLSQSPFSAFVRDGGPLCQNTLLSSLVWQMLTSLRAS